MTVFLETEAAKTLTGAYAVIAVVHAVTLVGEVTEGGDLQIDDARALVEQFAIANATAVHGIHVGVRFVDECCVLHSFHVVT